MQGQQGALRRGCRLDALHAIQCVPSACGIQGFVVQAHVCQRACHGRVQFDHCARCDPGLCPYIQASFLEGLQPFQYMAHSAVHNGHCGASFHIDVRDVRSSGRSLRTLKFFQRRTMVALAHVQSAQFQQRQYLATHHTGAFGQLE